MWVLLTEAKIEIEKTSVLEVYKKGLALGKML